MKTTSLSFLLALLLTAIACKKDNVDPNGLPTATRDGRNTAGFLLDGQPWLPQKSLTGSTAVGASWVQSYSRSLYLNFSRYANRDTEFSGLNIYLPNVRKANEFVLDQYVNPVVVGRLPAHAIYEIASPKRQYYTGPRAKGTVTLTRFDTVARVVSGTFELTVREDGGTDSLRLTQGRFDLTF